MPSFNRTPILRKLLRLHSYHWGKFLKIKKFLRFILDTNNYCNLHCEWCIVNRGPEFNLSPDDAELVCRQFKGIGERNEHRLVGGETTCMPLDIVREIIEIFKAYDRNLSILTNGYNILGLEDNYLKKLNMVILDDHGINHNYLLKCRRHIQKLTIVKVRNKQVHYNIAQGIKTSQGGCRSWISSLTLSQGVIYPCCNLPALARYHEDAKIAEDLVRAGWYLRNPELLNVLADWRRSISPYVQWVCQNRCWQPNLLKCDCYPITLKPNDVISKPYV